MMVAHMQDTCISIYRHRKWVSLARIDNRAENLYWGTHKENMADRKRNGHEACQKGSHNPASKLDENRVRPSVSSGTIETSADELVALTDPSVVK